MSVAKALQRISLHLPRFPHGLQRRRCPTARASSSAPPAPPRPAVATALSVVPRSQLVEWLRNRGLPLRLDRKTMEHVLQSELSLEPVVAAWAAALGQRDRQLLECILNVLCHLFLPYIAPSLQPPRDRQLRLPARYHACLSGNPPYLFLFRDMRGQEQHIAPDSEYFRWLEALTLEWECYQAHLDTLAAATDVYEFGRVVRMVSGLRANTLLSRASLLREHCPRQLQLHFYNGKAPQAGKPRTRTLDDPTGVKIYALLQAIAEHVRADSQGLQFAACQVQGWDGDSVDLNLDFELPDLAAKGEGKGEEDDEEEEPEGAPGT